MKYIYIGPGGFTLPYILGVCQFLKEQHDLSKYKIIGNSAGSWCATYLASDMYLKDDKIFEHYKENFEDKKIFYKWKNICGFLKDEFKQQIYDKNFIINKNVLISLTEYKNNKLNNKLINDYSNLDELLDLCIYSSFIPLLSGYTIPKRNNLITFDGSFSVPNFKNKNVILKISNSMFNRKFTINDILGKGKFTIKELYNLGYYDCFVNYHSKQFKL